MTHSFENGDAEIVREVAQRVEMSAARARAFGMALTGLAAFSMFVAACAMVWIGLQVQDLLQERVAAAKAREAAEVQTEAIIDCVFGKLDLLQTAFDQFSGEAATYHGFKPPAGVGQLAPVTDVAVVRAACEKAGKR